MSTNPEDLNSDGIDTESALADISSELFGQDEGGEGKEPVGGPPETPEEPDPLVEAPVVQNAPEVQATGAPSTWSKEALEAWATIPDRAKQEILKREEDMHRGIESYKEKSELGGRYDSVVEPYRAALAAENVDPVELFQAFAGNHYILSRGTEEQKYATAAHVLGGYGIDLNRLAGMVAQSNQEDPTIRELRQKIATLEGTFTQRQNADALAQRNQLEQQVMAFAADPAHVYFEEVANDIGGLLQAGVATTLEQAYEMAVYANPVTRQKELDRLTAEKTQSLSAAEQARKDAAKRATAADVKTGQKVKDGTVPLGSIDDTLNATLEDIRSRG